VLGKRKAVKKHLFKTRSPLKTLLSKDKKVFFRNTGEWTQLLVLSAIVVVYLFSIYKLPLDSLYLQNLISYFNIALIGFILAAVALRLVFPCFSMEGESLWILFSAPVKRKVLFLSKLVFGCVPVLLMALVLVVFSNLILKTDSAVFLMTTIATMIMAVGLSIMAVGFGAVFPRFDLNSIPQIESSSGGIFYVITALFYIVLNMSLWAMPVQNHYRMKFGMKFVSLSYFWWAALGLLIVNSAAFILPLWLGLKKLEKIER
jgi:ABC-2 type transport system permease protein